VTLYLIYADAESAGPGARRLAQILRDRVTAAGQSQNGPPMP
jgi:hypothetical protein